MTSSGTSWNTPGMLIPALLNATSSWPQRATVSSVYALTCAATDTSAATANAWSPISRRDGLDGVAVDVDAGDPRAFLREPDRARAPDAGPRAGDDRDLAREPVAHPCDLLQGPAPHVATHR